MYNYDHTHTAALRDGPVGRALEDTWNDLHDMEYALEQATKDYHDAAHFMGGPAEHDAQAMIKKIDAARAAIDHIAKTVLSELVEAEGAFVKKHGEPGDYSDRMRSETFPG